MDISLGNSGTGCAGAPLVKRIAGILCPPDDDLLRRTLDNIAALWGEPEIISSPVPFDMTNYYRDIAPVLLRTFICLPGLVPAGGLADWKKQSCGIEAESKMLRTGSFKPSSTGSAGGSITRSGRAVNIDPGYIDGARLVLASTKDHAHRIWLRDGIYAEVTLRWRFGRWVSFDYTFPDFKSGVYDHFLTQVRNLWKNEINIMRLGTGGAD